MFEFKPFTPIAAPILATLSVKLVLSIVNEVALSYNAPPILAKLFMNLESEISLFCPVRYIAPP